LEAGNADLYGFGHIVTVTSYGQSFKLGCSLTFHHNVPTISGIKRVQDAVLSYPFPSAFTEFRERIELGIVQKFANEILLELTTCECI